jgi:hypothetical protein
VDKPFEIHRVIVRLTPKAEVRYEGQAAPTLQPIVAGLAYPIELDKLIRVKFMDVSKNENLTKSPVLVGALQTRVFDTWEWEEPYTLVRSEGLQVQIDTQPYPAVCVSGIFQDAPPPPACGITTPVLISLVRIEITLEGFLIVVAPPSETR